MLGIFTRLGSISVPGSGSMVDKRVGRVRRVRFYIVEREWMDGCSSFKVELKMEWTTLLK